MKKILYYTDNRLNNKLANLVRRQIKKSKLPILSVSLKPMNFGQNIHYKGKPSYLTMFKQILTGLKASKADYIFMCEHDVLYHPSYFKFKPPRKDIFYYNNNCYKYKPKTGKVVGYDCHWLSQLCAARKILMEHYEKKLYLIEAKGEQLWARRFEPGTKKRIINDYDTEWFYSEYPNIDIRHGKNLTGTRRFHQNEFRDKSTCQNWRETTVDKIPGWDTNLLLSL